MNQIEHIAFYGRKLHESKLKFLELLIDGFMHYGCQVHIYKKLIEGQPFIDDENIKYFLKNTSIKHCNLLISLGGDGTFLDTAHFVVDYNIPICGMNVGRLGFLSHIKTDSYQDFIHHIMKGNYTIQSRSMLQVEVQGDSMKGDTLAFNDVYILRNTSDALMSVNVDINQSFLNTYWSDGLIISTPTGSTAYSLSCGGPIVMPQSNNFILTPISPHNLTVRPFIYSDDSELNIHVKSRENYFKLSLDGKVCRLDVNARIRVFKSKKKISMIVFNEGDYFTTLREKLMWGRDPRN